MCVLNPGDATQERVKDLVAKANDPAVKCEARRRKETLSSHQIRPDVV